MTVSVNPATDNLAERINHAIEIGDFDVELLAGTHLTTPGVRKKIRVPKNATLTVRTSSSAKTRPVILRPKQSVDAERPDDNYGLFFAPEPPTPADVQGPTWKLFTPPKGSKEKKFEYLVLDGGSVEVRGPLIDCNMNAQGLGKKDKNAVEHSAMLAFSGDVFGWDPSPSGIPRRVFVTLKRVVVSRVSFVNGNHGDDLWISRGDFHPNIEEVHLSRIDAPSDVKRRRHTIGFSGHGLSVTLKEMDVHSIHLEVDSNWRERPRKDEDFVPSAWAMSSIQASKMSLDAGGHVYVVKATRMFVKTQFAISRAAGEITKSSLPVFGDGQGEDRRVSRTSDFVFREVEWHYSRGKTGRIRPLNLFTRFDEASTMRFIKNKFFLPTGYALLPKERLFDSGRDTNHPQNSINARFVNCGYPVAALQGEPKAWLAKLFEHGTYRFAKVDLGALPVPGFVGAPKAATVVMAGPDVVVTVP